MASDNDLNSVRPEMPLVTPEPGEAGSSFGQRTLIIILVKWAFSKFFKGIALYSKITGLSEYISSKEK